MRFSSVLIANRGEIACRIIRTARDLGLRTVALYTAADRDAPHRHMADAAVCIGEGPASESYLDGAKIVAAALAQGAGAIHPGYGFLSENAEFARAVRDAGLVFIGPDPSAIRAMGDKAAAKRAMQAAGVPCVPGYEGADQSEAMLLEQAGIIGFPLMVKASAGGGGRGLRRVESAWALPEAIAWARAEAQSAFDSGHLILERAIDDARHVEIQVFADEHGTCLHLGERDCSVQRRHQKVIEEAPCPAMTPELRAQMGAAAIRAARVVDYSGAGTVEFLLDGSGAFYFLEMNTRLQVEHPVTEMVTGLDLVALQLQVAQGAPLGLVQEDIALNGHAIEARLYAEDPANDFLPATGRVTNWTSPEIKGVRVDTGIAEGQEISPFYDPMLAKIIAHGPDRDTARARLVRALREMGLLGVPNNRGFLVDLLEHPEFSQSSATTAFIAQAFPDGAHAAVPDSRTLAIAAALMQTRSYCSAREASRVGDNTLFGLGALPAPLDLCVGDAVHRVTVTPMPGGWHVVGPDWTHEVTLNMSLQSPARVQVDGVQEQVHFSGDDLSVGAQSYHLPPHCPWESRVNAGGSGRIQSPMPGLVVSVAVQVGARVTNGQRLAIVEAMKMQHPICADVTGVIAEITAHTGALVKSGELLITIEKDKP